VACLLVDRRRNRSEILVADGQRRPHSGSDTPTTLVPGDRRQPAPRIADARATEQCLVGREKDLLRRVFGFVHVTEHGPAHAVHHSPVALEEAADTSGGLTFEQVASSVRKRSARHCPNLVVIVIAARSGTARVVVVIVIVVIAAWPAVIVVVVGRVTGRRIVIVVGHVFVLELAEHP